jgi:uncharacterized membrane protein
MNRTNVILLILLAVAAVVSIVALQDPQRAEGLARMQREIAFQGSARDTAMIVFFLGVGGFIAYLLFTRR